MRISRIQSVNFQGLSGKRVYSFPEKITALILPNGSGKTSLLNAIRYGLTGTRPTGELISRGTGISAVNLTLETGEQIGRQESPTKGNAAFYNGKKCPQRFLTEQIEMLSGVENGTLKLVTSSDLLSRMKPQEFSDFLLSYIPKKLTAEDLVTMKDWGQLERVHIQSYFKNDTFDPSRLDAFYADIVAKRKECKIRIAQNDALLKNFDINAIPGGSKSELERRAAELEAFREKAIKYESDRKTYESLKAQRDSVEKRLKELNTRISEIKASKPDPQKLDAKKSEIETLEKEIIQAKEVYLTIQGTIRTLRAAVDSLNTNKCPLSDKLICKTDKTAVRSDLEAAIEEDEKALEKQGNLGRALAERLSVEKEALKSMEKDELTFKEKELLIKEYNELSKNIVKLPEAPKEPTYKGDLQKEYEETLKELGKFETYEKLRAVYAVQAKLRETLSALQNLADAFSPKGQVKQTIYEHVMQIFDDQCNIKADELKSGMRFRFVSDNGVHVTVDTKGTGEYLRLESLSGGEKIFAFFIILDMLNALSGSKILILDELSILDEESFRALIRTIKTYQDEYDQIILCMAEHEGLKRILIEEKIGEVIL